MDTITWAQKAVTDLEAAGWTLTRIAAETGASLPAISDLKFRRTKQPNGIVAIKLHELQLALGGDTSVKVA